MNSHLFNNRSRQISFALLLMVGFMMLMGYSSAAGGGSLSLDVHIKDGMESEAIAVGLIILLSVYVLIIFE